MTRLNTNMRTMYGPGEWEKQRMQAAQQGLLTEASPPMNSFDPAVFQQAAQAVQQNLAMQEQAKQAEAQRQMQREQMAMQERQNNARGTLDWQRAKADDRLRQRQLQMADRNSQQQFGLARVQESKRMGDQERLDANWQQQTAEVLHSDISEMLKAARAIDFTPEGRRLYANLASTGRALQGNRSKYRPAQWAQMAGQFMDIFEEADLGSYQKEPLTIKQVMANQMHDIGNGKVAIMEPDGSRFRTEGGTDGKALAAMAQIEKDGKAEPISAEQRMLKALGGDKNADFSKAYKAAEAELQAAWQSKPGNEDKLPPKMDPAEVRKQMRSVFEQQVEFERELMGLSPSQQAEAIANGEVQPVAPEEMIDDLDAGDALPVTDPTKGPNYGKIEGPGYWHDLKGQYAQMFDAFRPEAVSGATPARTDPNTLPDTQDPEPLKSREEADIEYFQGERQSQIKEMFDAGQRSPRRGGVANPAFQSLSEQVREAKLGSHPARFIDPRAVDRLQAIGSKDPVGDAAMSVATTLKEKGRHFALLSPMEQEALSNTVPVIDPKTQMDEIKKLKPGDYYMDPSLRIHRIPPHDKTMAERAVDPLPKGVKFNPNMFRGIGP